MWHSYLFKKLLQNSCALRKQIVSSNTTGAIEIKLPYEKGFEIEHFRLSGTC